MLRIFLRHLLHQPLHFLTFDLLLPLLERRLPCDHLVQEAAQCPPVRAERVPLILYHLWSWAGDTGVWVGGGKQSPWAPGMLSTCKIRGSTQTQVAENGNLSKYRRHPLMEASVDSRESHLGSPGLLTEPGPRACKHSTHCATSLARNSYFYMKLSGLLNISKQLKLTI